MTSKTSDKNKPSERPSTPVAVSWFEFLLDESLLEKHLKQDNPVPSGLQLIIQFLQQANNGASSQKENLLNVALNKEPSDENSTDVSNQEKNKKTKALKLLALKAAAHLKWDLSLFEKSLPYAMIDSLLAELLDAAAAMTQEVSDLTDEALFSLSLWHRWTLRSVIQASFPSKVSKASNIAVPGLTELLVTVQGPTEAELKTLTSRVEESLKMLKMFKHLGKDVIMPTLPCIGTLKEDTEEVVYCWDKGISICVEDFACQICYDLGCFHFYKENYSNAHSEFKMVQDYLAKIKEPMFSNVNSSKLLGYSEACHSLLKVIRKQPTLLERVQIAKSNNYQGLIEILLEDNQKGELCISLRKSLQEEVQQKDKPYKELYNHVCSCNTLQEVANGRCVLSYYVSMMSQPTADFGFLMQACQQLLKVCSQTQRQNIICFLRYLCQALPKETQFTDIILNSPLVALFQLKDLEKMREISASEQPAMLAQTFSSIKSADVEIQFGELEHQLIACFKPAEVISLVKRLAQNISAEQIMNLTDKWKLPRELKQALNSLEPELIQLSTYILVTKGKQCLDLNLLNNARELFIEASYVVKDACYKLSKSLKWEVLMADLQIFEQEEPADMSMQDISKQVKTCLTALRLETDNWPRPEVVAYCTAFLVNAKDWSYLSNLDNTLNGYIEFGRLLSNTVKESMKTARKPARELWDAIVLIFTTQTQTKRSSTGASSIVQRDSQLGLLTQLQLMQFFQRIKEPLTLALLVSCLTQLYSLVKEDVSSEISSEFMNLWPTALSSSSLVNIVGVTDCVTALMQHALSTDPTHPPWFKTQADIYYSMSQYSSALRYYLECGAVATEYFSVPLPRYLFDDATFKRMIRCCTSIACNTQAAVLCQFLEETDYTTAFKVLQDKSNLDATDAYYNCIWDSTLLEFIIHLHNRRGELDKKQVALQAIGELELNSSNPDDILYRAAAIRKQTFLRAMAKQYL